MSSSLSQVHRPLKDAGGRAAATASVVSYNARGRTPEPERARPGAAAERESAGAERAIGPEQAAALRALNLEPRPAKVSNRFERQRWLSFNGFSKGFLAPRSFMQSMTASTTASNRSPSKQSIIEDRKGVW